ncbi:Uncharacterised protein [Legionella feeleii]|uniref:Uncharacterized protein n=1 Tax=Legionella feeleii TaxID=453 RepID=A0A378IZB1_9GAMM|nr:Uncharacterised protein [Legionella feeleii]
MALPNQELTLRIMPAAQYIGRASEAVLEHCAITGYLSTFRIIRPINYL